MQQGLTCRRNSAIRHNMKKRIVLILSLLGLVPTACVQVNAPDKPIEINLNIAIRQDVIYSAKVDEASKKVIDSNLEIF